MRTFRALVVDDESAVRMLTIRSLANNGFCCDGARDGLGARELVANTHYDVVVTDLRMPEMNGHTLAIELLERHERPAVVVLTGVTEPKLATDLIARGVDDILFKPVDPSILAAKVRALVERRATLHFQEREPEMNPAVVRDDTSETPIASQTATRVPCSVEAECEFATTVSKSPIDIKEMIRQGTFDSGQLVIAINQNKLLASEVLKVANSGHYNPTGKKLVDLKDALVRIGLDKTAEIAVIVDAAAS